MSERQNDSCSNFYTYLQLLAREASSQPVMSDFFESLEVVGSGVFCLFVNKPGSVIAKRMLRIETEVDGFKRRIISLSKTLDCSAVLNYIDTLTGEQIRAIGVDFFYITSKKLVKSNSIKDYARFVRIMFTKIGYENNLIRNFFFTERDADEACAFIGYVQQWAEEEILSMVVLVALDKLSNSNRLEDVNALMERYGSHIKNDIDANKPIQKLIVHSLDSVLYNHGSSDPVIKLLKKLVELGFELTATILNKMLDLINRSFRNDGLLESILSFMEEAKVEFNLITYNSLIDYYSMQGQFDKAYAIFESLPAKGFQADNYTFSILLKGIKNMKKPDVETADRLFKLFMSQNTYADIVIFNSILDVYISNGLMGKVAEVYDIITSQDGVTPDQITFNTLIKGCCRNKDFENAMKYFREMRKYSLKPNRITYNSLMDLSVKDQKLKNALYLIEEMQKDDITADGYTYSIILNGLKLNESPEQLVRISLDNLMRVLDEKDFKVDEALFNTILDVCSKYEMYEAMEHFHGIMVSKNIKESMITFGVLLKAYTKREDFDKAFDVFKRMLEANVALTEVTYGGLLDSCAKIGRMDLCIRIYETLQSVNLHMNSIIFTTILKGYLKLEHYEAAMDFFNRIKKHTAVPGMLITYNCALDILVHKGSINDAMALFEEISKHYRADVISYSTIIKGLCLANKKGDAFEFVKKMIDSEVSVDISVVNLFLDHCSSAQDYRLGIKAYQHIMMKNVAPNEITFGIMVKLYGFARDLPKAFELLDLMMVYEITPSIIVFTNLVHISFYNKNPKKADLAFTLFKKQGLKGDRLLYSKLIDGFMRFNEHSKVLKYIDLALADKCALKKPTMDNLYEYFYEDDNMRAKLGKFKKLNYVDTTEAKQERVKRLESQRAPINVKARDVDGRQRIQESERTTNKERNGEGHQHKKSFKNEEEGRGHPVNKHGNYNSGKGYMKSEGYTRNGFKQNNGEKKPTALFNFRNRA